MRTLFQPDSPLQLQNHPNAALAWQASQAIQQWNNLAEEERPSNVTMELRLDTLVEALQSEGSHASTATPGLTRVIYHLVCAQRLMDLSTVSKFQRLGSGSFATVFVNEGRGSVVIKQVQDPSNAAQLCKEYQDLDKLWRMCTTAGPQLFQLPRAYGQYHDYWSFAKEMGIPRTEDMGLPPHAMYTMQRIWPVSQSLAIRIRDEFFPQQLHGQPVPQFLARLYFGRSLLFNSENFPLDTARIEQLGLPAADIAAGMGQMLAFINFYAGRDGRDIEFVLCGNPDNPLSREPSYACIDFNQMRPHSCDVNAICSSIVSNDPYYPRPGSPYWDVFKQAYIAGAAAAPMPAKELADAVIAQLQVAWTPQGSKT